MNKHQYLVEAMKIIAFDFNNTDFSIIDNGENSEYVKKFSGTQLRQRSCSEIIFKPLFMEKLEAYVGSENIANFVLDIAKSKTKEKTLLFLLNNKNAIGKLK